VLEVYEIIERIGGNMGLVFKARQRLLDKVVALKLLPADAITDPARLARFRRELKIMGQLEHPNLVTTVDARIVGRWHMVAMEFIDGTDLERLVETRGALPIADACEAARQAALALQYAHQHGLIHRDIKPSNLMLTHAGTIKVIDMGLAVIQEASTGQLTRTGLVMGTMRYCAPEQFRDASRVDIRADIYSLGCTLYHLLTGKPPYSQRTTLAEVVQAHLHEPFPGLSEALPDAPAELNAILARMTAKEPDARFATPGEVAAALEPFARKTPLSPEAGRPTAGRKPSKIPWVRIAAVVVLLLAIAGVSFLPKNGRKLQSVATNDAPAVALTPAVALMDTTASNGIYDEEDRLKGTSNADVLKNRVLRDLPLRLQAFNISSAAFEMNWRGENDVIALQPALLVIHRSVFFHVLNAILELGYPAPTNNPVALAKWQLLYRAGDHMLIAFMANVATASQRTQFLVYSTGTDPSWKKEGFRKQWKEDIEARFPVLKGRIRTMWIPPRSDGKRGTFKDADTAEQMRHQVKTILQLPDE
jgi:serine/threonine protein kinase